MKQFFSASAQYNTPTNVLSLVKSLSPQLFLSGSSAGKYSFLVFNPIQKEVITHQNPREKYALWKKKFIEQSKNYSFPKKDDWKYPFCGGVCGAFSYDFLRVFEDIPLNKKNDKNFPLAYLGLYENFFVFDHTEKKVVLAGYFDTKKESEDFFENWIKKLKNISLIQNQPYEKVDWKTEITEKEYLEKFEHCQNELLKGNTFQVNLSQKFTTQTTLADIDIYRLATEKNPAPMMYFAEIGNNQSIISCSPERLFSCDRDGNIFTQPIAGTRKRGKNKQEDEFFEHELKSSVKEISEHSMLVDLLRNDFGKISQFGSVKVKDFARIEKYKTVMHLVSDIVGKISSEKTALDVFEAVFPGGTITGCPKPETMKILAREEISSRNFYCGSAGYFSFCGSADTNILIRTIEKNGENISARAGGGIVFGADGKKEYQETLHKFAGVKRVFE